MRSDSGFTLLEVMVALAIIALVLITVISAQSQSVVLIEKSRDISLVAEIARSKMTELENRFGNLDFGEIPEKESGAFEQEEYQGYRWSFAVASLPIPAEALRAATAGQQEGPLGMGVVSDIMEKAIRILNLTISWGSEKNPQHLTLTRFLVRSKALPSLRIGNSAGEGQ